jgi:hypothetical protein
MAITLEQAKGLRQGQTIYHVSNRNSDGTPQRWRVTNVKTWKRNPSRVQVGLKYGLRHYDTLREHDLDLVCLTEEEALGEKA